MVMKKNFTLFFLFVGFAFDGVAQNQYWNYHSYNVPCPKSAVSIVHENENIYYFQSDPYPRLAAVKINSLTMLPTGTPKFSYVNSDLIMDGVASNIYCYGWDACPQLLRDTLGTKAANISHDIVPEITIISSHQFVCQGFDGKIRYALYDMTGRFLSQGTTINDIQNFLPNMQGVYILKATDEVGGCVIKKS